MTYKYEKEELKAKNMKKTQPKMRLARTTPSSLEHAPPLSKKRCAQCKTSH